MQQEGVIKFQLDFTQGPPLTGKELSEINAWRRILFLLRLIGQDPERYDGLGYGNLSERVGPFSAPAAERRFIISGTQTGGLEQLEEQHYVTVTECYPDENRVVAEGPIRPSSESLTHGTLYGLDDSLRSVMHVHSPEIWRHFRELGIPRTAEDAAYGSPEMAAEVRRLLSGTEGGCGLFAMGGHEDGLVAFGRSHEEAGTLLLQHLAKALQL
ncbi:MAG: class II aldolase/adducin family protein [Desulfuromonadales bacterium]